VDGLFVHDRHVDGASKDQAAGIDRAGHGRPVSLVGMQRLI
jgi:hypothetical protein